MADSRKNVRFIGNPGERFLSALTEYSTVVTDENVAMQATVAESRKYLGMRIVEQLLLENQRAQAEIENVLTPLEPRYGSTHTAHHHDPPPHIIAPHHGLPPQSVSTRSGYSLGPLTPSRISQTEYAPFHTPSMGSDPSLAPMHTPSRKPYANSGSAQHSAVHNGVSTSVSEHESSTSSSRMPTQRPSSAHVSASSCAPEGAQELSNPLVQARPPFSPVDGDGDGSGYGSMPFQPIEELPPTPTSPYILSNGSFGHGPSTGSVSNGSVYSSASSTRRKRWAEAGGVSKPIASILPPPPGVLRAQIQQQRAQQQQQQQRGSVTGGESGNALNGTFTEELPLVYADGVDPHSRSGAHASFLSQTKPRTPEYEEPRGPKGGVVVALDVTFRNNVNVPGNKSDGKVHSNQATPNAATFDDDEEGPENVPGGVLPGFTRRNSGFPGTQTGEIYCKRSPSVSSRVNYGSRSNHSNGQDNGQSTGMAHDSDNEDGEAVIQKNNIDAETDRKIPEESDYGSRVHAARLKRMEERRTKLSRDNKDKGKEEDNKMKEKCGDEHPASRQGERARSRSRPRNAREDNARGDNVRTHQEPPESSSTGGRVPNGASTATTPAKNTVVIRGSAHHPAAAASEGANVEKEEEDTAVRDMIRHLKSIVTTTTAAPLPVSSTPNEAADQVSSDKEKKQDDREKTPKKKPIIASSNKKLILNALQYLCLAGNTHDSIRTEAVAKVTLCSHNHFVILLKQTTTLKYSGIYISNVVHGVLYKLVGEGPEFIVDKYILQYYKYDSAGKQWSTLPSQKLTLTTDAVTLNTKRNAQNLNKFNLVEG